MIIYLYKEGYSQNDLVRITGKNRYQIRLILDAEGVTRTRKDAMNQWAHKRNYDIAKATQQYNEYRQLQRQSKEGMKCLRN